MIMSSGGRSSGCPPMITMARRNAVILRGDPNWQRLQNRCRCYLGERDLRCQRQTAFFRARSLR